MNTKEQPILPWYESAAHEIIKAVNPQIAAMRDNPDWEPGMYEQRFNDTVAIIARHDPHATTLRLLELAHEVLADVSRYPKAGPYPDGPCLERGTHDDVCKLLKEIRAHLAAQRQTGGGK